MRFVTTIPLLLASAAVLPASVFALPYERAGSRALAARAPVPMDPPPYSRHDPNNGKKPAYQRKDPYPIPKYRINDPYKFRPEQQPKASKRKPRSLDEMELLVRGLGEDVGVVIEARNGGDPPKYSRHDPINGKKPGYQRKDPFPIPKYRINDPYKFRPEQQPKASKQKPRSLERELLVRALGEMDARGLGEDVSVVFGRDLFGLDDLE